MPGLYIDTILVLAIPLLLILLAVAAYLWQRRRRLERRKRLMEFAEYNGLVFGGTDQSLLAHYRDSRLMDGKVRDYGKPLLSGTFEGLILECFEYFYGGVFLGYGFYNTTTVCAFYVDMPLKHLIVRSRHVFDPVLDVVGLTGLELGSAKFLRRFKVLASDEGFAREVLHEDAVEFLLARPGINIEVASHYVMAYYTYKGLGMYWSERLSAAKAIGLIREARRFVRMLPVHLGGDIPISGGTNT